MYIYCSKTTQKNAPCASCSILPPQSWYVPLRSSLRHLQYSCSTLCFVYAFLGRLWSQHVNQLQTSRCGCFNELWHMNQPRSQIRTFSKVTCHGLYCIHGVVKREIFHTSTMAHPAVEKSHCCMVEPFNISSKILLGDLKTCFQGDGVEKTLNVCTITPGKFKWKHSIHASRATCGLWL